MTLRGEIDMATAPWLADALRDPCYRHKRVKVDLRDVSFIDSSGVQLLLRWAQDAARGNLELRVIPGPERVQKVFEVTGVLEALGLRAERRDVRGSSG